MRKIDSNSDGNLARDELIASLQGHVPDGADASAIADKIIQRRDKDGDGQISKTGFSAGRPQFDRQAGGALLAAQETEQSDPSTDATALITKYDTDQDGNLSADELASSLGSAELGKRIADNIVALFDQDGDGSITADEVTAKLQSEAPKAAGDDAAAGEAGAMEPPAGGHRAGQGRLASIVVNFLLQTESQAEAA